MQKTAFQYLLSFGNDGPLNFVIYSDFWDFRNFIGNLRKMAFFHVFKFQIKISQKQLIQ